MLRLMMLRLTLRLTLRGMPPPPATLSLVTDAAVARPACARPAADPALTPHQLRTGPGSLRSVGL